jgi:phospholipid/cholesterol/gamma-HCH transport system ATP-binding protein
MRDITPVLDLSGAQPDATMNRLPPVPFDLRLMPGDCALIEMRDPTRATEFADLCCGLLPLRQGLVRFLGRDWARRA